LEKKLTKVFTFSTSKERLVMLVAAAKMPLEKAALVAGTQQT
jgi:hypothetical protein